MIFWIVMVIPAVAQKADTTKKIKKDYLPTGIRVGTDLGAFARTLYADTFEGVEFSGDIDFYRYYFNLELGSWGRTFSTEQDRYENSGSYLRAGIDINFLVNDPDKNMVFLGVRYGTSSFSEEMDIVTEDVLWGGAGSYAHNGVTARWLEGTFGIRVKMWKMIWLGYTARYKFGLHLSDTPDMIPHDVPGYGLNSDKAVWGFNYHILVRLPFRKSPQNNDQRSQK